MIIVDDVQQGTPEWMALRVGSPGASGMDKIITSTGKSSTQRQKYLYQLAGEILIGEKAGTYRSATMDRGVILEPEAREVFEFLHGPVEQCGVIYPDERKLWHISPDGFNLENKFGLEIKSPLLHTHCEYLDKGKLPTEYVVQVQTSLACTGWDKWYFLSYYPGLKSLIVLVERDENLISLIKKAVEEFCFELKELVKRLKTP